jgi:hypothetical protein
LSTLANGIPSGASEAPACYRQFCAGPEKLKIVINNVYYPCIAGSTMKAEDFGGSLTCPSNYNLCANTTLIADWPEFTSIDPTSGNPGTPVTIKGTYFVPGMTLTIAGKAVSDAAYVDSNTYTGTVSTDLDLTDLVERKVFVILTDSQGRTAVGSEAFLLQVDASDVLNQIGDWLRDNPIATAFIVIGIVLLIAICVVVIIKERRKARYGSQNDAEELTS